MIFTEDKLNDIGNALCMHENYAGMIENGIRLEDPGSRTRIRPGEKLDETEQEEFDACKIVHLSCQPKKVPASRFVMITTGTTESMDSTDSNNFTSVVTTTMLPLSTSMGLDFTGTADVDDDDDPGFIGL